MLAPAAPSTPRKKRSKTGSPLNCYKSIGGVECFREPYHRDQRRLVNYFGPHPSRFEKPEPPEPALVREEADKRELARLEANPDGTTALLKQMGIGPHGEVDLKKDRRARLGEKQARAIARAEAKASNGADNGTGIEADGGGQAPAAAPQALPQPPLLEIDVN